MKLEKHFFEKLNFLDPRVYLSFFSDLCNVIKEYEQELTYYAPQYLSNGIDCRRINCPDSVNSGQQQIGDYWSHLMQPQSGSDLFSKRFLLLDEIQQFKFETYSNLVDYILNMRDLIKKELLNVIIPSASLENILKLLDTSREYYHQPLNDLLFSEDSFWKFLIFRHGNAGVKLIWDRYLSTCYAYKNNELCESVLTLISKNQRVNLKKDYKILDEVFISALSSLERPIGARSRQEFMLMAVNHGLQKTTTMLFNNKIFSDLNDITNYGEIYYFQKIAYCFKNFEDSNFIAELCKLFWEGMDIREHNILKKIEMLRALLQALNYPVARTEELKNTVEYISGKVVDNINEVIDNRFYCYQNKEILLLLNVVYDSIKFDSPYFFEKSLDLIVKIHERNLSKKSDYRQNLTELNLTEIMVHPSFNALPEKIKNMAGYQHLEKSFKLFLHPDFCNRVARLNPSWLDFYTPHLPLLKKSSSGFVDEELLSSFFWAKDNMLFLPQGLFNIFMIAQYYNISLDSFSEIIEYNLRGRLKYMEECHKKYRSMSLYEDEVFCMNVTLATDYFLSRNEKVALLNEGFQQEDLSAFFRSTYKKGLLLWVRNHLMQRERTCAAIKVFQAHIEDKWLEQPPYHGVWTVRKHFGFEKIHEKYERFASQLIERKSKGLHFSQATLIENTPRRPDWK